MTLSIRINNLEKAIEGNRSKSIVKYKFKRYMEEYELKDKDIFDKIRNRELSYKYFTYMGEKNE